MRCKLSLFVNILTYFPPNVKHIFSHTVMHFQYTIILTDSIQIINDFYPKNTKNISPVANRGDIFAKYLFFYRI